MPSDPRELLIVGLNFPPEQTGIAPYTGSLARALAGIFSRVRVVTAHPHYPSWKIADGYGQWTKRESDSGAEIRRLRHYVPGRPGLIKRALSEITFGLRAATTRWGRPDIVLAVSPALLSSLIVILRARARRSPPFIVVWVQDLYQVGLSETGQSSSLGGRILSMCEGFVLRRAHHVIVIHDRFAAIAQRQYGISPERTTVVRNWTHLGSADRDACPPIRRELGWSADETIVLHAGNMGVKQGLDNVIEAARIAHHDSLPIKFALLGHGTERRDLEQRAAGLPNVVFHDSLSDDDFVRALHSADVLLVNEKPGVAEMAVPSKLTSYFDAAKPVLAATDENGITAEEINAAGAGIVVTAGQPRELIDAVQELRLNPTAQREFGRNARQYRESILSESAAVAGFMTVFGMDNATSHHRESERT